MKKKRILGKPREILLAAAVSQEEAPAAVVVTSCLCPIRPPVTGTMFFEADFRGT